jgi:SulP family sulfate permease
MALLTGTALSLVVLEGTDVRRIGEIPTGLPSLQLPVFSAEQWEIMLIDAAVLGMLGCIDALLTSVIADNLTCKQHNSDKELIGQGLGNMVSGLFGGLPGAGATMGTVVNIQSGGRTALSGLLRAGILIVLMLGAAELTALIPLAVLAGIAMHVGLNIIDWRFIRRAPRLSGKGALIMYGVILLTVFEDLIIAVGVGLFVANVITIRRLSDLMADDIRTVLDPDDEDAGFNSEERRMLHEAGGCVLVVQLSGPMIFGASKAITDMRLDEETAHILVLDLQNASYLGVSAGLALERAVADALATGTEVYVCGAGGQVQNRLETLGLLDRLSTDHVFATRESALRAALSRVSSLGIHPLKPSPQPP